MMPLIQLVAGGLATEPGLSRTTETMIVGAVLGAVMGGIAALLGYMSSKKTRRARQQRHEEAKQAKVGTIDMDDLMRRAEEERLRKP